MASSKASLPLTNNVYAGHVARNATSTLAHARDVGYAVNGEGVAGLSQLLKAGPHAQCHTAFRSGLGPFDVVVCLNVPCGVLQVLLSTAGLLTVATSAGQPTTQALNASCDRFQDRAQKALCQQLLAKLQQSLPAGGVRLDASGGVLSSTQYPDYPTDDKPNYEEDKEKYQHSEYYRGEYHHSAEDEPYGYDRRDKDPSDGPPGYYDHEPQTPSGPLYSAVETGFGMSLVPKSSTSLNASGLLTQNDFTYWIMTSHTGTQKRIQEAVSDLAMHSTELNTAQARLA